MEEIYKRYFLQTNIASKKPKIRDNDIAICCPVCREGSSWERKQRCHLYQRKDMDKPLVHCYNCGVHTTLENYLNMVDEGLAYQFKRERLQDKVKELKENKQPTIKKEENKKIVFLENLPFKKSIKVKEYLKTRHLEEFWSLFYYAEDDITIQGKYLPIKNSIITPLTYKDKIYGFQARKLDKKMFISFLPDENMGLKVWNFFNVNLDQPIFIFESVFDALSSGLPLENIVAAMGSDIPQNIIDKMKYPVFCFDNQNVDETAFKKIEKLIEKYHCFLWPKDIKAKDFNELLNTYTKEEIKELIKKNIFKGLKGMIQLKLS